MRRVALVFAPYSVLLLSLTAAPEGSQEFHLAREDYPIVTGSTSAQPLGTLIAGRVTRTSVAWRRPSPYDPIRAVVLTGEPYDPSKKLTIGGTAPEPIGADLGGLQPSILALYQRVRHAGTSQSFEKLAAREADLAIVAREPTADERANAKRAGVELVTTPIARDAFVFLSNASNPVKNLTLNQIRDIYSGRITNWDTVGGSAAPIVAYQRDASSGSQVEMEALMKGTPMLKGPDIAIGVSMFGPFNAIRTDVNGIGYSYHYYERFIAALPEVATLAIDGVAPSPQTIDDGKYPIVTFVYLVWRSDLPRTGAAARLRDWLRTPAGQAVVAESGYVALKKR